MFGMFNKKDIKTIDMSTGELIAFKPVSIWTKAKFIEVDDVSGSCGHYDNVEFRVIDKALIIKDNEKCIVYNLEQITKYFFVKDNSPHTK